VTAVKAPTVNLSQPITQDLPSGSTFVFNTVIGVSGQLVTSAKTPFTTRDSTAGNLVEAVIAMPDAAQRILDHYVPNDNMPPLDLAALLDLDKPWCNGQPEERIQLSMTDAMAATITTLGPDGKPIVTKPIVGVKATSAAGNVSLSIGGSFIVTGVKATSKVGHLSAHGSASYGRAGYGTASYTTP